MTENGKEDTKIILYQWGVGPYVPSLSPFALKLETYLRMAKIPYEVRLQCMLEQIFFSYAYITEELLNVNLEIIS